MTELDPTALEAIRAVGQVKSLLRTFATIPDVQAGEWIERHLKEITARIESLGGVGEPEPAEAPDAPETKEVAWEAFCAGIETNEFRDVFEAWWSGRLRETADEFTERESWRLSYRHHRRAAQP